ncbi:MAG: guanylate kinase, partial [Clostridia bacterium]|nr:guanylate kinase [Clostridia bacterium]
MKQSTERGLVVIVSGPSASGKGTVVDRAMEKAGEERVNLRLSVSMTTRGIGRNEVDGESYYFV